MFKFFVKGWAEIYHGQRYFLSLLFDQNKNHELSGAAFSEKLLF